MPNRPKTYHDKTEILAALEALAQDKEAIASILGIAVYRILGAYGHARRDEAEDLFNEAVAKTLNFERKWKRGISFRNHILACMRSEANNRFKKTRRYVKSPIENAGTISQRIEPAIEARANTNRLRNALKDDSIALDVLETMLDGCKPQEATERLRISPNVYWSARGRIYRLAEKLFLE